jgi:hypothetical protein
VPLYASAYAGYKVRDEVRALTYGEDVGQSGWVTADELEHFGERLQLGPDSRLLDVGCGSGARPCVSRSAPAQESPASTWSRTALPPHRGSPRSEGLPTARASSAPTPAARSASRNRAGSQDSLHRPDDRHRSRNRLRARGPECGGNLRLFRRVRHRDAARPGPASRSSTAKISPRTWRRWPAAGTTHASVFTTAWRPTRERRPSRGFSASSRRVTSSRTSDAFRATPT